MINEGLRIESSITVITRHRRYFHLNRCTQDCALSANQPGSFIAVALCVRRPIGATTKRRVSRIGVQGQYGQLGQSRGI